MSDNSNSKTKSGADLAQDVLSQQSVSEDSTKAEVEASDQLAQTLTHLQNLIESNASQLSRISDELKLKRESLRSVFENDQALVEAQELAKQQSLAVKERKTNLQSDPQTVALKTEIADLNDQKKDVEETLNNHLLNYYQLTNSTSVDTSDGDQWDFTIKAKLKNR